MTFRASAALTTLMCAGVFAVLGLAVSDLSFEATAENADQGGEVAGGKAAALAASSPGSDTPAPLLPSRAAMPGSVAPTHAAIGGIGNARENEVVLVPRGGLLPAGAAPATTPSQVELDYSELVPLEPGAPVPAEPQPLGPALALDAGTAQPVEETVQAVEESEPVLAGPEVDLAAAQPVEAPEPVAREPEGLSQSTRPGRATTFVNMRDGPDNGALVVTVVPPDASLQVVECKIWCEVIFEDQRGWIYRDFVEPAGVASISGNG